MEKLINLFNAEIERLSKRMHVLRNQQFVGVVQMTSSMILT